MPSGVVTADNMRDYLALPMVPAVSDSWMTEPALLREGRWDEVTAGARGGPQSVITTFARACSVSR
ncbi:beta/alpha barrel domain-containing protein [Amycolatopsis thermoflava]|uniref:hypothetical protein n=1 Tax=Amycolatopsis thermoflava TaxID=84480 RepID=UPI00365FB083